MTGVQSSAPFASSRRAVMGVVLGGLVAGILDILYAFIDPRVRYA